MDTLGTQGSRTLAMLILAFTFLFPTLAKAGGNISIPVRWCTIDGVPTQRNPGLVGEPTIKDVLWRRHERVSDNIFIPQARITFRSASVGAQPRFPVLTDLFISPGSQPGDILDPGVDGGREHRATINACRAAWQRQAPMIQGITAVHIRRFVNAVGNPTNLGGISGLPRFRSTFDQRMNGDVMVIDNAFTLATDRFDTLLGHELGHALSLWHGDGVDRDADSILDGNYTFCPGGRIRHLYEPNCLFLETLNGLNLMQYRQGRAITVAQRNQVREQAIFHIPDRVIDPEPVPLVNTGIDALGDVTAGLEFADINEFGTALDADSQRLRLLANFNGLLPDNTGFTLLFVVNLDDDPATGGDPSTIPGIPAAMGIELVAKVQMTKSGGVATTSFTVFKFDVPSNQFVMLNDPGLEGEMTTEFLQLDSFDPLVEKAPMAESNGVQITIPARLINPLGADAHLLVQTRTPANILIDEAGASLTFVIETFPVCEITAGNLPRGLAFAGDTAVVHGTGLPPNVPVHVLLGADPLGPVVTTDAQGGVNIPILVPAGADTGRRLITIGLDGDIAITADCILKLPACDIDQNGSIDRNDINAIFAARNTTAADTDPRDIDDDGTITVNDARVCTLRCSKRNCAP